MRHVRSVIGAGALALGVPAAPIAASATTDEQLDYADTAHWVCRPDTDDVCDNDLEATSIAADGTLTPVPFEPADDPGVDCFYLYPTVSTDPTPNSDLDPVQERLAALKHLVASQGAAWLAAR